MPTDTDTDTIVRHGYVYAFCNVKHHLLKVGMTASSDERDCDGRIKDYIKQHSLPREGWEFVGFVATKQANQLEKRLHSRLRPFRMPANKFNPATFPRELFQCSIEVYCTMLDTERVFLGEHVPETDKAAAQRAVDEAARRAHEQQCERVAAAARQRELERTRAKELERAQWEIREDAARAKLERERVARVNKLVAEERRAARKSVWLHFVVAFGVIVALVFVLQRCATINTNVAPRITYHPAYPHGLPNVVPPPSVEVVTVTQADVLDPDTIPQKLAAARRIYKDLWAPLGGENEDAMPYPFDTQPCPLRINGYTAPCEARKLAAVDGPNTRKIVTKWGKLPVSLVSASTLYK